MHSSAILDNPTWRMVIHNATHGAVRALFKGFLIRNTTQPFGIQDIKNVLGLSEKPHVSKYSNRIIFKAVVVLTDGRHCFIESWQTIDENGPRWSGMGAALYARSLQNLLSEMNTEDVEILKLHSKKLR